MDRSLYMVASNFYPENNIMGKLEILSKNSERSMAMFIFLTETALTKKIQLADIGTVKF